MVEYFNFITKLIHRFQMSMVDFTCYLYLSKVTVLILLHVFKKNAFVHLMFDIPT